MMCKKRFSSFRPPGFIPAQQRRRKEVPCVRQPDRGGLALSQRTASVLSRQLVQLRSDMETLGLVWLQEILWPDVISSRG
ncbi:unnamed protein product [Amoebophrya sp. A25]|nr:unnamed protein product [Amoebophrya sp. A25]|eukprot:GSA25T00026494001.1